MSKLQKTALVCSILFCLNYALDTLMGFDLLTDYVYRTYWMPKLVAFLIGVVAFLNLLLFKPDDQ